MLQITRKNYGKISKDNIIYLGTHVYVENKSREEIIPKEENYIVLFELGNIVCYKVETENFMSIIYLEVV